MTSANDDPKQPVDTQNAADRDPSTDRKLIVIEHSTTTPSKTKRGEVIRDLVVPKSLDDASKSDNLRSPEIQD